MSKFTYLSWPVKMKVPYPNEKHANLHVTQKFFGELNSEEIATVAQICIDRVPEMMGFRPGCSIYMPGVWNSKHDASIKHHVLMLYSFPFGMFKLRERFSDVVKDQFAQFNPHITVDPVWFAKMFGHGDFSKYPDAKDLFEIIPTLQLRHRGEVLKEWVFA